ncbi:MAG: hypothetical protein COB29_12705 [Sulfitobacter sp.]|nr:MAG: hypothetical protein COB29_12705 [Sulfitobacter sp.]
MINKIFGNRSNLIPLAKYSARNSLGFTLVELLVVMLIIASVSAIVGLSVGNFSASSQLRDQSVALSKVISETRFQALRDNKTLSMSFSEANVFISDKRKMVLPNNMRISFTADFKSHGLSSDSLHFFPDGSTNGGKVNIMMEKGRLSIVVKPLFGTISIR